MAGHNEPQHGTEHAHPPTGAEPARSTPPPTGAEPGRGAAPPAGAKPSRGTAPSAPGPPADLASSASAAHDRQTTPGQETLPGESHTAAGAGTPGTEPTGLAAELDAKLAELEDRWLRAVADLDNLRKRMFRDIERSRAEERARVAGEFLPVLDNLDLALQHADAEPASVAEGVRAIREQAIGVLARLGYPRLDEEGVPFDPARHEAVSTAAAPDAEPGTIAKVLRPGYGDGEQQLRPAMVVVATDAGRDGP